MSALTFAGPPGAIDELGVWTPDEWAAPREFALESWQPAAKALPEPDAAVDALVWQQDLTAARTDAIGDARGRLVAAAAALPQAETRAAVFASAGGLVAGVRLELAGPERDLAEWAQLADADALRRRPDFRAAAAQVAAFFEKVRAAVSNYARVATRIDGATVAVTEVTWTGHFHAGWAPGLNVDDARRHRRAVALALRTRDLWLRLAATVLAAAAQLTALFAANPLLALPAAYRFARQVIEQAQTLMLA
jgi:hypothetical protein